jgi:hypothetical protein
VCQKLFFFVLASTERNFHTKNAIAIAKVREKNVVAKLKELQNLITQETIFSHFVFEY